LRSQGYRLLRIWEHTLSDDRWVAGLRSALRRVHDS
jgi:hypothetical protein